MVETRYGIISDTHENPGIVSGAIEMLKHCGAEKLIVNGDLGTGQEHIVHTLSKVGKCGLESYVQPGSHERLEDFEPVMDAISKRYPNVGSAFDVPKVENNGHHLVFLPGSDFLCGGQYQLLRQNKLESGFYKTDSGQLRITNMNDLRRLVTNPDRTIVVSHVPRKFDNGEDGVDMAYFAENSDGSVIRGAYIESEIKKRAGEVSEEVVRQIAEQNGLSLRRENRGNADLRELYEELGIRKSLTGHFHEGVHNAHDSVGMGVSEGEFVDDLFWMASYLDGLKAGILRVNDVNVAYQNIDLRNYLS